MLFPSVLEVFFKLRYEAVEKAAVGHGGLKAVEHTNLQPSHYDLLLLEVRDAWMQGNADQAGIAEPFRGCKKAPCVPYLSYMSYAFSVPAMS